MAGVFHVVATEHSYRFELVSGNGDTLLRSGSFNTKSLCLLSLQNLKENIPRAHCFQKINKSNGQYYFIVERENDGLLATSELFWSEKSRDYAIMMVKKEAPGAEVKIMGG